MSMAFVHDLLYQSEGLAEIDFNEYIQTLTSHIFRSYTENIGGCQPKYQYQGISYALRVPPGGRSATTTRTVGDL